MRKVILLFMLVACSAINALAQSFTLSGSEHEIVNGVYTFMGVNKLNQPLYMHPSSQGQYEIFYDNNGVWWLGTDKGLSGGTQYYKASGTADAPPLTGWLNDKGEVAPVALVADPRNAEIIAARNAAPVLIKGLGDNSPEQSFEIAYVTGTGHPVVQDSLPLIGNTAQRGANTVYYMTNLRVSGYRINNSGCSFGLNENPDPRYRIRNNFGYDQVLNPGNDKDCNVNSTGTSSLDITPAAYNNSIPISAASPFQMTFNIDAWEEDGCGSDNTYDNTYGLNCTNHDEFPAYLTNYTETFNPNNMYVGRTNGTYIQWTGNGTTYDIYLSWELSETDKVVSVYSDANQSGRVQQFGVGSYYYDSSLGTGVGNDAISSMTIAPGYKVTAYNHLDLLGYPMVYRGTVNDVGGFNDKISSLKVEYEGTPPPTGGKTLLIYFNGSGKSIDFQLSRNASKIKANDMIFIKGIGGGEGPSTGGINDGTYSGYNNNNFQYKEGEELFIYVDGPSTYYSHANVFKNTNDNAPYNSYLFGVDMQYDGSSGAGYDDEDSYTAASNVLRVLKRYNLRGYDTILISGHSRGSAVGISSFLHGIKKAVTGTGTGFAGYLDVVNDVFGNANVINVLALDPVAGLNAAGFRNDFHMGDNWRADEMYSWFKGQYPSTNFSEIYANGGRMVEVDDLPTLPAPLQAVLAVTPFYLLTFDPSPNYLYNNPANNVQRYWLGYRHSSMENSHPHPDTTEKLSDCYDIMGVNRPMFLTVEIMNAALHNQTLFRDNAYWFNKFRKSDMDGWLGALKITGCSSPVLNALYEPDRPTEMVVYHATRHTNFSNIGGDTVHMNAFVGNNNIEFRCSGNYPTPIVAGNYTATDKFTDADGFTHYCNCKGELLLGIKVAAGDPTPAPSEVSLVIANTLYPGANISDTGIANIPGNTGFVTSPTGTSVMSRKWHINSTTLNNTLSIRDYFDGRYLQAFSGSADTNRMWFYKSAHSPTEPIANIPTADIYVKGTTASLTEWKLGRKEKSIYAEYLASPFTFGSGGGGYRNPICTEPTALTLRATDGICTDGAREIYINSSTDIGTNYQLFRNGSPIGSPIAGTGGPTMNFGVQTVSGAYTVVATTVIGGCKKSMDSIIVVGTLSITLYVDANATGNGSGSSWANAMTNLNTALDSSPCGKIIKVAAGTYKPHYNNGTYSRDFTFHVSAGTILEGGYNPATGTRTFGSTILSGDLNDDDVITGSGSTLSVTGNTENVHHVMILSGSGPKTTIVDGFTITGGNANGTGIYGFPYCINCIYARDFGGGIYANTYGGSITFTNNTVYGNSSTNNGGGIYASSSQGNNTFTNNTVYGNSSMDTGGGIYASSYQGNNTLTNNAVYNNSAVTGGGIYARGIVGTYTNNTIYGNSADYTGGIYLESGTNTVNTITNNTIYNNADLNRAGGLFTVRGTSTISNNIFWGNKKTGSTTALGADYKNAESAGNIGYNTFTNNLLQLPSSNYTTTLEGGYALGTAAAGNIFAQDPHFVDAAANNLQLGACSPAMDAGTNTGTPALDRAGNTIFNTTKDIGAYERQTEACPVYTNAGNGCQTITMDNVTGNQWFYFNNNKGRIAALNPNGQNLGTVTVEVNDGMAPITRGTSKFLGRSVNINSTTAPTANYTLRLYYYDAELTEYNTATNGTFALSDFNMSWASGGTNGTGCDLNAYANSATSNGLIAKADVTEADYGAAGAGFYLEMALNHFTTFAATTSGGSPLPVKLLSFTGYAKDKDNLLEWTTATEQNNAGFEVQVASPDPSQGGETWQFIGFVRGAGNSTTVQKYDFTDNNVQGNRLYKLKQIDFDGKSEFSNTIFIKRNQSDINITAYPNPSKTGVFTLKGKTFDRIDAVVTNVLGQNIPVLIQNNVLDLSGMPSGIYFIRIADENNTIRVVKE